MLANRRRLLLALPVALAAIAAARYRARRIPWAWQPESLEEEIVNEPPPIAPVSPPTPISTTPTLFTLLSSVIGLACFIAAQGLLLQARHPIAPLILFIVGFALLIPILAFYESSWLKPDQKRPVTNQDARSPRWYYLVAALFFAVIALLAAQTRTISPLLIFSWLMSIILTATGLPGNERILSLPNLTRYAREIVGVLALMVVATLFHTQLPAPTPLNENAGTMVYDSLDGLYFALTGGQLSSLMAVLLVPAVYLLGRIVSGARLGIFAAGFAAVSGWTPALGKTGHVYSLLAIISALVLAALIHAERQHSRSAYIWPGILLGLGTMFSPLFVYMALLIPLAALFVWLDERRDWKPIAANHALALLMLAVVALPFVTAHGTPSASPDLDPLTNFADGLSSSLLLFNLTSDPSPFHGIVNRPAFSPVLAAAFLVGLLGLVWRASHRRRWADALLPTALVISLLPSAVASAYPDLQRASVALPIALIIAASGFSLIAHLLIVRWGLVIFCGTYLLALVWTAIDAQTHYTLDFLPTYEQAASTYADLETGR